MNSKTAAKRRKNTAHGAGRGFQVENNLAPKGRQISCRRDSASNCLTRLAKTLWQPALALVFLSATLHAQEPRIPITRDEVWQAVTAELRHRGVHEEQLLRLDEIDLPTTVPATPGRSLRVSMVCWDAELERAQFQIECRQPGQCVPFLAYAAAGRSTAMGSEKLGGSSCRNVAHSPSTPSVAHKPIVRVGDRATVFFRGSALRMTALVTCLERGGEGDLIRVRNQDGQIFRARIFAPARLEALSQ